jgi:hypothetical protein
MWIYHVKGNKENNLKQSNNNIHDTNMQRCLQMEAFVVSHMPSLLLAGDGNPLTVTFTATKSFLISFTLEQDEPFYLLQYYLL